MIKTMHSRPIGCLNLYWVDTSYLNQFPRSKLSTISSRFLFCVVVVLKDKESTTYSFSSLYLLPCSVSLHLVSVQGNSVLTTQQHLTERNLLLLSSRRKQITFLEPCFCLHKRRQHAGEGPRVAPLHRCVIGICDL